MESPRLAAVRGVWDALEAEGLDAAIDALLSHAREDALFVPYSGEGREFKGVDAFRDFMREVSAQSAEFSGRARSMEEHGNTVIVFGQVRVRERDGRLREAQVRWTFDFDDDDDRIVRVTIR